MTLTSFIHVLLLVVFSIAESFTGKVAKVSDGDTIEVMHNGNKERIRLYGIDCPEISHNSRESGQPFGQSAKEFTYKLVGEQEVTVDVKDTDSYGRTVGIVKLADGKILNEELLKAGLAWHYTKYDHSAAWQKLEDNAKEKKLGLWADKTQVQPWEWRHQGMAKKN